MLQRAHDVEQPPRMHVQSERVQEPGKVKEVGEERAHAILLIVDSRKSD
jgi:hypothetical protein